MEDIKQYQAVLLLLLSDLEQTDKPNRLIKASGSLFIDNENDLIYFKNKYWQRRLYSDI